LLDSGWFYDPDYQWEARQFTDHLQRPRNGSGPILQKDSFLAAYSLKNGKLVWKTPREEISSWVLRTIYEGKTRAELIAKRFESDSWLHFH